MQKFKKGIFIGKFYPLHLGHLSTLRTLAVQSQEAFLIFYNDPPAEARLATQFGINYGIESRLRDARAVVRDMGNVTVLSLSIPPGITFPRDFLKVKKMVEEQIGGVADVQIFGEEEAAIYIPYKYADTYLLGAPYEVEDEKGSTAPLHATAIRNNYSFYKKYIPPEVQKALDKV